MTVGNLRIDGGMSANEVFTQALANACGRPVEIAPFVEATTLGAAFLAGMAVGTWADEQDVAAAWAPRQVVEPASARLPVHAGSRPGSVPRAPSPSCPPLISDQGHPDVAQVGPVAGGAGSGPTRQAPPRRRALNMATENP